MRPLVTVSALVVLVPFLVSSALTERASPDPAAVVEMTNTLTFTPDTVTIGQGETVRWKNTSVLVHTVTADPEEATLDGSAMLPAGAEAFNSGNMDPEDTFEHTFEAAGTYTYFCVPHEAAKMRGTVVVTPSGSR